MPVRGEGLLDEDEDAETPEETLSYVLHPNCGIFEED
jgi:hypothetical protein